MIRSRDTTQADPPHVPSDGSHSPLDAMGCALPEHPVGKLDAYLVHLAHLDMPIGMKIDLIAALTPVNIAPSRPAGPRAPVRPGPTKTAMGIYRPYRGRRDESRSAPPRPAARTAAIEEVQHV